MKRLACVLLVVMLAVGLAPTFAQDASTVNIALQQEPDTLSPLYTAMWFAATVQDLVHAPLWFIDNNLNLVPTIAAEIPSTENGGISADGTVITVKLRPDAVWSDGTPLTAADYVFTYDMTLAETNTVSSRFPYDEKVASVEAADPQTLVVTYNEPYAAWYSNLFNFVLPAHILQPVFDADGTLDNADWNRNPDVVSGPFVLEAWEPGSHMSFVPNANYYAGQAKVAGFYVRFVPDDATVVSSLIAGDSDVGTFIAAGDTPALTEGGNIEVVLVPSGYNEGWFFNLRDSGHPALDDVNVRRALVMLFNRDQINADLNLGLVQTGSSFWENTPYQRPDAAPIPYDPAMANQLLDEAGWVDSNGDGTRDKDGVELVLRYVTNQRQLRKDIQAIVQQEFEAAGVGVDIQNFDSDIFFASYGEGGPVSIGEYDIAEYSATSSFPDPDSSRFLCTQIPTDEKPDGENDTGLCLPELDALFAEQARTVDINARIAIFHQIDQIMFDQVTWTNVWYDPDLWAINTRITNTLVSGADPLWNAVNWEISS